MAEQQNLPGVELYDTVNNKTFHGLLIAEFLAAFNDQCIHAAAMFFAIRKGTMTEAFAISLMPLLFYSPWAIFAPYSAYLADRLSKRTSLIFWKVAEVGITGLALLGFFLGSMFAGPIGAVGPWLVMAAVFLMGTHSAFYVPNKYGVLPEIFTVRMLSRANGLIESTTFLAVILGTTCGGVLSLVFQDQESWIGIILVILALIGTLTSLFIRRMPPADPNRPFPGWMPWQMFKPLFKNLAVLARSRLASTALFGLAFFTFMVAYMRATMYMFGQSQNPHWNELETSLIVAVVSLGVGLGSPLAGYISGGKVELGLVPLGALGMIAALVLASFSIHSTLVLIIGLVLIGLGASLYLVPLYSLLQYSAPKGSKGMSVATNNFTAVIGAMLASIVFISLVQATRSVGIAEPLVARDVATGKLTYLKGQRHHPESFSVTTDAGAKPLHVEAHGGAPGNKKSFWAEFLPAFFGEGSPNVIKVDDDVHEGDAVIVSEYTLKGTRYFYLRPANEDMPRLFDQEEVPRFLFLGAAVMMFVILTLLCLRLADFPLRSLIFLRSLGQPHLRVLGYQNLPTAVSIMVTNTRNLEETMPIISGIVRPIHLILPASDGTNGSAGPQRYLAGRAGTRFLSPSLGATEMHAVAQTARAEMARGFWVVLSNYLPEEQFNLLLSELEKGTSYRVVPVASLPTPQQPQGKSFRNMVIIGESLPAGSSAGEVRKSLDDLEAMPEAQSN